MNTTEIINRKSQYAIPLEGITFLIMVLSMLTAPFVSSYLMVIPLMIQVIRAVINQDNILSDIAFLITFSVIYCSPGGDSFLALSVLIVDIILILLQPERKFHAVLLLNLLLAVAYFAARIGNGLTEYIFVIGSMLLLFIAFSNKELINAVKITQYYIGGTLISSLYAYAFQWNTHLLKYFPVRTLPYYVYRFTGLNNDPNYYGANLVLAIAGLIILKWAGHMKGYKFYIPLFLFLFFGAQTASKSFALMALLLSVFWIYTMYHEKKYLSTICLMSAAAVILLFALEGKIDLFGQVFERFKYADNIDSLTTGRFESWLRYSKYIISDGFVFWFGRGFGAPLLVKGTHNIFLEILYTSGVVGLLLLIVFVGVLYKLALSESNSKIIQSVPIICWLLEFSFLQGMVQVPTYLLIFISLVCARIPDAKSDTTPAA